LGNNDNFFLKNAPKLGRATSNPLIVRKLREGLPFAALEGIRRGVQREKRTSARRSELDNQ
jgi:hypothetical protein